MGPESLAPTPNPVRCGPGGSSVEWRDEAEVGWLDGRPSRRIVRNGLAPILRYLPQQYVAKSFVSTSSDKPSSTPSPASEASAPASARRAMAAAPVTCFGVRLWLSGIRFREREREGERERNLPSP